MKFNVTQSAKEEWIIKTSRDSISLSTDFRDERAWKTKNITSNEKLRNLPVASFTGILILFVTTNSVWSKPIFDLVNFLAGGTLFW